MSGGKIFRKFLIFLCLAALMLTGCTSAKTEEAAQQETDGKEENGEKKIQIGLTVDSFVIERWIRDRDVFVATARDLGAEVNVQDAGADAQEQISQIDYFIKKHMDVIVIIARDCGALSEAVERAHSSGIRVISYDRMVNDANTDMYISFSYYATFDNYKVGQKQGEYLVDALDLDNQDGPFNIELFTGDPGDNNCNFFFGGAMDVLQKYIDDGKLVVKSGQTEFEQVATANWDSAKAQDRMDTIIAGNYSDGTNLDAVLCSNDSTALGVENALAASYTGEYPIITGQDCDTPNVKNLVAGKQAMSVFKDTRALASAVVKMVDSIMKGEEPEVNDTESYDNGTGVIPTYLCDPVVVTTDNYKEVLIDSGYYTEDQIK